VTISGDVVIDLRFLLILGQYHILAPIATVDKTPPFWSGPSSYTAGHNYTYYVDYKKFTTRTESDNMLTIRNGDLVKLWLSEGHFHRFMN
jgi:hypothetical protein